MKRETVISNDSSEDGVAALAKYAYINWEKKPTHFPKHMDENESLLSDEVFAKMLVEGMKNTFKNCPVESLVAAVEYAKICFDVQQKILNGNISGEPNEH